MAKQFVSKRIEEQRQEAEQRSQQIGTQLEGKKTRKQKMTKIIIAAIALIIILSGGIWAYSYFTPGKYDSFAKCLTEKGAIVYGAEWCQYTSAQKAMFGKSFKYLNYKLYDSRPGIKITPTWKINGQLYEKVQAFDRLAALTGCQLPK